VLHYQQGVEQGAQEILLFDRDAILNEGAEVNVFVGGPGPSTFESIGMQPTSLTAPLVGSFALGTVTVVIT
jgi:hypothetical protein